MKKHLKRALALALCALMLAPFSFTAFAAEAKRTSCSDDCEFYPTIIVPGLGQSSVCVTDDDGNFVLDKDGNKISAFPAYIQIDKIVKRILPSALATLALQKDVGFSDAFADVIDDCFGINSSDLEAQNTGNVITEKFPYSYEECSEYERSIINSHIPFDIYPTDLPKDHLYYFSYNSFGNHIDLVDELYDYVQLVKAQTGHDKINIVPISQGGGIFAGLLEYHPDVANDFHKVICIVPALNGSRIIGDVFNGRIKFLDADYLYNGFLEELRLLDEYTARLIEILVRILPDEVIMASLEKGVDHLVENVMIRSTSMWSLCPAEDYPGAAEKYLSSPEMADIKAQTDKYYHAQLNARANVQKLVDMGVQVFNVAEYNFPIINVGDNWNTENGDYIIQLDSTSMGAYSANCGETLPDDYVQKNTHCSNPGHNHISPDRVVDASAGLLPDTTFYFEGQRHDLTQHNDVILKIAMRLIADDDIKDVYSSPEFPQFLSGRNVKNLLELIDTAESLDGAFILPARRRAIDDAVKNAKEIMNDNLATGDRMKESEQALAKALAAVGKAEVEKEKNPALLRRISEYLYDNYGTNGYSEMPAVILKKIGGNITDFFKSIFA